MAELLDDGRLTSPDPLVAALILPPRPTSTSVSRPRLLQLMETAARSPIVIVSGEAAAGKTSVVVDWVDSMATDRPLAWMTLPRGLDDQILFWRYVLAAIDPFGIDCDDLELALADSASPSELWLTTLANRLAEVPNNPVFVLNDFQELQSADAQESLLAFLEKTSVSLHVILVTRSKPPWHLTRWQVSGRLAEVDSADLRYTREETRALVDVAGIVLSDADVALLVKRTEGWAGGIRLALLSMRHAVDPGAFVARLAADEELVSSYLFREVLEGQPPELREFLFDISILDQITPEIGDALRGRHDSAKLLERCRAEYLFITESSSMGTYRLHSLFAQLLRATLGMSDPDRLLFLRRRASIVFEDLGDIGASIAYAVDAHDQARIGELVAARSGQFAQCGRFDEIRSWHSLLGSSEQLISPEAALGLAMTLGVSGRTTESLEQLEHLVARDISLRVEYAATQVSGVASMVDGRIEALADIATALDTDVPGGDDIALPFEPARLASYFGGVARFFDDDLIGAGDAFEHAAQRDSDPDLVYVESPGWLARLAHARGDLSEAEQWARKSLTRNEELGGAETAVATPAYLALADVAWERDHLDDADVTLAKARRSVRPLLWYSVLVQISASRLLASRGELDNARHQLIECGQTYLRGLSSPLLKALLCERAIDLALMAGDADDARQWENSYATEVRRPLPVSLQLQLAASAGAENIRSTVDEAVRAEQTVPGYVDTLLAGAALVGRVGDERRCIELVSMATHFAESNGLVRRFLDAGPEVHNALRTLVATPPAARDTPTASRFFLESLTSALSATTADAPRPTPQNDALVDPLTRRELQVLDLLVGGQSYAEIGASLYVSRNTVKSHASHIYTKLGVSGRVAATDAGRRLGLV